MPLPKALLEQEERANELHRQMYQEQEPAPADTPTPEPSEPISTELEPEPAPDSEAEPDPEPTETVPAEQHRKLEAAHQTLQGKYRAEVPRMQEQIRTLQQELIDAQRQRLQAEQSAQAAEGQVNDLQTRLREEFGDEAADTLSEYARTLMRTELDERQQQTTAKPESQKPEPATQDQPSPEVTRFWNTLRRRVPDFDQVNVSPAFITWLQNPDPTTGLSYQETLNEAGADLDVLTVIDVVSAFKQQQTAAQPHLDPKSPAQQVSPQRRQPRATPQKPQYTVKDYTDLQNQIRRGEWVGREAEAQALEQEIHAALFAQ